MPLPAARFDYRSKQHVTTGLRDGDFNLVGPHPLYLAAALGLLLLLRIARKRR